MKIDLITDSYKSHNEDGFGFTEKAYWVLDGASALNKNNYTHGENDVAWVVNWWVLYLEKHIDDMHHSIGDIIKKGVYALNTEFSKFIDVNILTKLDVVSLGIAVVRMNDGLLEYFVLGDVEINIKKKTGTFLSFTDTTIKERDQRVIDLMTNDHSRQEHIVFKGFTTNELELLKKNRSEMNSTSGYYILEHDPRVISKGIQGTEEIATIEEVMIFSDGYAQMYNTFTLSELFQESKVMGLEQAVKDLRLREEQDKGMDKFQRLKKHDDVTAIRIILDEYQTETKKQIG